MPDIQAAYRGLEPQTVIILAASRLSRTIDPRRSRGFTITQRAEVQPHPEVKLLHGDYDRYRKSPETERDPSPV